jgi:hypothetical protein
LNQAKSKLITIRASDNDKRRVEEQARRARMSVADMFWKLFRQAEGQDLLQDTPTVDNLASDAAEAVKQTLLTKLRN